MDNNRLIALAATLVISALALTGCGAPIGPEEPNTQADSGPPADSQPEAETHDSRMWCALAFIDGKPFPVPVEQRDTLPAPMSGNNMPCVRIAGTAPAGLARFCCPN